MSVPRKLLLPLAAILIALVCGCLTISCGSNGRTAGDRAGASDGLTTARIKTALLLNPHLNGFKIDVDTKDGAVRLTGSVPTSIQKDLAGEIAKSAGGVVRVTNDLQAGEGKVSEPDEKEKSFSQSVSDATTTASVKLALAVAKGVKAHDIDVSTRWGTVTLKGQVGTRAEKALAEKVAEDASGVKEVVNDISVRG